MAKFKYIVKDAQGKTIQGEAEAFDKGEIIQQLQKQGFFIFSIEEFSPKTPEKAMQDSSSAKKSFTHRGIKLNDLVTFARQLAAMLQAGVTLLRALEVIRTQIESERLHRVLGEIINSVEQGSSLSEALAVHPKIFNQFWVSLVEVGEASGTMPMVLNKLTFYLEQQAQFRAMIVSAIMYPVILFFVCSGAIAVFALFIGPRFEDVFTSMKVELPLITKILLGSFRFFRKKFLLIFFGMMASVFIFQSWARTNSGKRSIEMFLLGLPTFGNIYRLIIVERFTSQMAILVDSGVPILHALDITERLVDNLTCSTIIKDVKESVRQGEFLVAPMMRSGFFPAMTTQMISVGEETGELSKMLKHVASFYQDTVATFMKRLGTVIEPVMLLFMGAIIGVIVLAMFLPMFNISQLGGAG